MKKLIAGNWKMNGTQASAMDLISAIGIGLDEDPSLTYTCDFLVCPPALHLTIVKDAIEGSNAPVSIGGQDCSANDNGAHTGDVSSDMLADMGCEYVILGHSERRADHEETSAYVSEKAGRALISGLKVIICVGEQEEEREEGREFDVVAKQLRESLPNSASAANTVIAYEPVWAIGTGKAATTDDVAAMHSFIRKTLQEKLADAGDIRILYGGSVKPDNAGDLFKVENVDGALIGGASLKADQYLGIAKAV